jgi:hypothetical protein
VAEGDSNKRQIVRKLLAKILLFFLIANGLAYLVIHTGLSRALLGGEVYQVISLSKEKTRFSTVLLGDSVSRQLYNSDNYNGEACVLTSTGSISLAGQYILFNNIIEKNPQIREAVLILVPKSLQIELDDIYSDNYFFKPFCTRENDRHLTPRMYQKLHQRKYYPFFKIPLLQIIGSFPGANNLTPPSSQNKASWYLSGITVEYLVKLKQVAAAKNVRLRIVPAPVTKDDIRSFDRMAQQIRENHLEEMFSDYFRGIAYLDDARFKDHLHYHTPGPAELAQYRNMVLLGAPHAQ